MELSGSLPDPHGPPSMYGILLNKKMRCAIHMKSSVDEIRERFDKDVERFSNLETGQTSTVDAALAMELVAEAAASVTPHARRLLDVGCGAGNYSLKVLQRLPGLEVTLIDLSRPMLERAQQRLQNSTAKAVHPIQGDIREIDLGEGDIRHYRCRGRPASPARGG